MRKFYLSNGNGEQLDLNKRMHFFQNPSGLGMEKKVTYEQIGDYFLVMQDLLKQKSIEGEIFFPKYEDYRDFVRFAEITPLTLVYVIDDVFNIDVKMDRILKTERGVGGLHCKVRFTGISPFYKKYEVKKNGTEATGKVYDYEYNYMYTNSQASTVTFNVDSTMECPSKLTIIGPALNPIWTYRLNDEVISTGKILKNIPEGRKLVIDTTELPYSIKEMDLNGDNEEDVYQYSDFSTKRFLLLKNGANIIRISHDGSNDINLILERRELYATV